MRVRIFLFTVVIGLLAASVFALVPSVPNLINFQGRLTDASGVPVADGVHAVTFRIYSTAVGGVLLWDDPVAGGVTTSGGLFTYELGSDPADLLPVDLFQDNNEAWLEVEADAVILSPRTRLISTPYTRVAGSLEVPSAFVPGVVGIATFGNHQLSTYGSDGQEQIRLWGASYGEILLHDADPTNDETVRLTANASSGGELELRDNGGLTTIDLHGGLTGDASAILPTDAINSLEIKDEPGIAHSFTFGSTILPVAPGTIPIESVTITYPANGYVVVTAHGFFKLTHVTGTDTWGRAFISTVRGGIDFDNFALFTVESSHPSFSGDKGYRSFSLTKVEAVTGGTTVKYYLNADRWTPNAIGSLSEINRVHLLAQYFPTAYGTVVSTVASVPSGLEPSAMAGVPGVGSQQSEVRTITVEEHNARLKAEVAEMKARLQTLEEQVKQQNAGGGR